MRRNDPRVETIPDTEPDLDESMILAPMRFDDRIIGVIVLSKLGLDQFIRDDLRYLEIYASMAAQAMANADTTELLRAQSELLARQLAAQRELMRATESILSTLDPRAVMEEIAERIGGLVHVDMLALTIREPTTGTLQTLFSRGDDPDVLPLRIASRHAGHQRLGRGSRRHAASPGRCRGAPRSMRLTREWQRRCARGQPASRPGGRDRHAGPGSARTGRPLRRHGAGAHPAVRGPRVHRAPERRRASGGRDARPDRLTDGSQEPGHLP